MTDREIMLESEIAELRSRLARAERLERYIPAAVIEECVAVLDHGEIKHPGEEWKKALPHVHMFAATAHIKNLMAGSRARTSSIRGITLSFPTDSSDRRLR